MPESNLTSQQFLECLQAISRLMQSVNELQDEIRDRTQTDMEHRVEIKHLKESLGYLQRVVQGEGGDGGLHPMIISQKGRITSLENWKEHVEENSRVGRNTKVGWVTLVVASTVAIMTSLLTTFVPIIIQLLQKKSP